MTPRSQSFKVFVPSGHSSGGLEISGKLGARPDASLRDMKDEFYRSKLPNMDHLTFTFGTSAAAEAVKNFITWATSS